MVRLGTTKGERKALRIYRRTNEADANTLAELSGVKPEAIERLMPILKSRDTSLEEPNPSGLSLGPARHQRPHPRRCGRRT